MKNYCKACGEKLKKIINIKKTPPCDLYTKKKIPNVKFYSLDLYSCVNCKLIQLLDIVEPEKIYKKYMYKTQHSIGLINHFKELFKNIDKEFRKKNKKFEKKNIEKNILDIGCNDGTLLSFFKKKKYKVIGIDPANNILNDCKKKKIKLLNKFFTEKLSVKLSKKKKYNLITANNVIANIPNLSDFFKGISNLLSDEGLFVFETIYGPSIVKNKLIDMINSEHIFYFSLTSLKKILLMYNLRIVKTEILKSKGGSIRVFAEKTNLNKKHNLKNYKKILNSEKKDGFSNINRMIKYNKKYSEHQKNAYLFLKSLKQKKFSIHGFGASAGSTSIFYQYKLKDFINIIYDDNILRHNLYLPGSSAKVVNPRKIKEYRPKYILVMAWRYINQIMMKHRQDKNKAIFISLLPKLKIYK